MSSKEVLVLHKKRMKTDGFQGCINYGNDCNFDGFYLATYSTEGMCKRCEIKSFPERFKACILCKMVATKAENSKQIPYCYACKSRLEDWLIKVFKTERNTGSTVAIGIHSLISKYVAYDEKPLIYEIRNCFDPIFVGLYTEVDSGNYPWQIPDPSSMIIDISDITWENKMEVVERELFKNNIKIHESIQFRIKI